MGVLEFGSRESLSKRRKLYCNSMTMESNSGCTMLGPKGLIKKHEFVRVLIQCLNSLGLHKTASCLESESGISYKSKEFEVIESEILNAKWEDCIKSLHGIKGLTDEMRCSSLFLVVRQYLLECMSYGDDSTALGILQKRVASLKMGTEKVHSLAFSMLLSKGKCGSEVSDNVVELRKKLSLELEKLLPPPVTVPERRLEHLVESALSSQIDSCLYHNSPGPVSLYEDHCCGRDEIPSETVQILTAHQNEVWFVQFSNGGDLLASSSADCTAIIWKI